jgi:hypothetical protein
MSTLFWRILFSPEGPNETGASASDAPSDGASTATATDPGTSQQDDTGTDEGAEQSDDTQDQGEQPEGQADDGAQQGDETDEADPNDPDGAQPVTLSDVDRQLLAGVLDDDQIDSMAADKHGQLALRKLIDARRDHMVSEAILKRAEKDGKGIEQAAPGTTYADTLAAMIPEAKADQALVDELGELLGDKAKGAKFYEPIAAQRQAVAGALKKLATDTQTQFQRTAEMVDQFMTGLTIEQFFGGMNDPLFGGIEGDLTASQQRAREAIVKDAGAILSKHKRPPTPREVLQAFHQAHKMNKTTNKAGTNSTAGGKPAAKPAAPVKAAGVVPRGGTPSAAKVTGRAAGVRMIESGSWREDKKK